MKLVAADDPDETEGGDYINANFIPGQPTKHCLVSTRPLTMDVAPGLLP